MKKPSDPEIEAKLKAIHEHAERWEKEFERITDDKLVEFANEPLDKKTAIVCTGFIVQAIKDLHAALISTVQIIYPEHKADIYYSPKEPTGTLAFMDDPRGWIAQILTEVATGPGTGTNGDDLCNAYCNQANFGKIHADYSNAAINHYFNEIAKTPLPNDQA